MKPATPLPFVGRNRSDLLKAGDPMDCYWEIEGGCGYLANDASGGFSLTAFIRPEDATYIVHAANNYLRLVEALRELTERCDGAEGVRADGSNIQTMGANDLLQELGELNDA